MTYTVFCSLYLSRVNVKVLTKCLLTYRNNSVVQWCFNFTKRLLRWNDFYGLVNLACIGIVHEICHTLTMVTLFQFFLRRIVSSAGLLYEISDVNWKRCVECATFSFTQHYFVYHCIITYFDCTKFVHERETNKSGLLVVCTRMR